MQLQLNVANCLSCNIVIAIVISIASYSFISTLSNIPARQCIAIVNVNANHVHVHGYVYGIL